MTGQQWFRWVGVFQHVGEWALGQLLSGRRAGAQRLRLDFPWGRSLLFAMLCSFLIVSCQQSTPKTLTPRPGNRLVLGTTATVETIDPANSYKIFTGALLYNLGDRLYTYKLGTDELVPQLARDFPQVSGDGLTYTIPLRQGVLYHDGTPFNAETMAFSLNRFIQNRGAPSFLLSDLIESVQATGAYELTIQLKNPFAAFPSLLAFSGACAVSPNAYKIGQGAFVADAFVGTGPYKLVRYGTDQLQLDAFDQYWGGKPANQGVDIQFYSSPANLFNAFRTGAVDVAYQSLSLDQVNKIRESAAITGWRVLEKAGGEINYLTLNVTSPPLDRLEVRQALAAIVDRQVLRDRIFQGQVEPLYTLIPSTLDEEVPTFQTTYGDSNAEKARELLTQAGYSETNPLKVEFWYRSNIASGQLAAVTLKAIARQKLGKLLQLELRSVESTTANRLVEKGVYPTFLFDWAADFLDADNYIEPFLRCSNGSTQTGCIEGSSQVQGSFYYSERANDLVNRSRREQDPEKRRQIFAEIQQLVADEVPYIPFWQNKDFLFTQPWIQGASLEVTQKVPLWTLRKHQA